MAEEEKTIMTVARTSVEEPHVEPIDPNRAHVYTAQVYNGDAVLILREDGEISSIIPQHLDMNVPINVILVAGMMAKLARDDDWVRDIIDYMQRETAAAAKTRHLQ
jgi:hypothetical protein